MTATESVNLQEIKDFVNVQLDVILNFAEFISGEKPSSKRTRIIAQLRLFQEKFAGPTLPSTTIAESRPSKEDYGIIHILESHHFDTTTKS